MRTFLSLVLVAVLATAAFADSVAEKLQRSVVNVKSGSAQGSGTIVIRPIDGKNRAFVVTAQHVIDDLRQVKTVIQNGAEKKVVTYRDAAVVQEIIENGTTVGERRAKCRIVCVSAEHDVAVMEVRWASLFTEGVLFDVSGTVPVIGTELYHAGSPGGQEIGAGSVTSGIISSVGRGIDMGSGERAYDQITCSALPGSSGGAVVRKADGVYVGTLTLGLQGSDTFHWIVPIRRTLDWAREAGIEYLFDPKAKPLTAESLLKVRIEGSDLKVSSEAKSPPPQGEDSLRTMLLSPSPRPATRSADSILKITTTFESAW